MIWIFCIWIWNKVKIYCNHFAIARQFILSLQPASTLILPTCRLGLWVGRLVGWVGGWVGGFCGLWVWGWWVCYMLELFLWVYGSWNTFDIFFVQYCSMCYMCLKESHPSGDSDLLLLALPGSSLGHIFIIFYLFNVLLLLWFCCF